MRLSSLIPASFLLFTNFPLACSQEDGQSYLASDYVSDDETACHLACSALLNEHPESTHYSSTPLSGFQESFYTTQQGSLIPACIITPPSALAVSSVIKIIAEYSCHFTVKSGGHSLVAGASNSDGGITIDLRLLNEIEILEGGNVTRVGTGNRWKDVYAKLEPLGKTIAGGRNGEVGVGGFILGGGISFLSRRYGWSCDTVLAFSLVLPNGTLTTVTPTSSPDLFTALRGGGSNFGIVTSFDLETFPQGQVWAGSNIYLLPPSSIASALSAIPAPDPATASHIKVVSNNVGILAKIQTVALKSAFRTICFFRLCTGPRTLSRAFSAAIAAEASDPNSQMIFSFSWGYEAYIAVVSLVHSRPPLRWDLTKPPPPPPDTVLRSEIDPEEIIEVELEMLKARQSNEKKSPWSWDRKNGFLPHVYKNFTDLPRIWNTNKVQNLTDVYDEIRSYNIAGFRQLWGAISFHLPPPSPNQPDDLVAQIIEIWIQEIAPLLRIPGAQPSIVFQPLYPEFFVHAKKNGGNAMNIDEHAEKGPLILFSLAFRWLNPSDDLAMNTAGNEIYARVQDLVDTTLAPSASDDNDDDSGLMHEFIYQNYASVTQDVFAGYGPSDDRGAWREHLRSVQRSIDPAGTWRHLRQGYFEV